MREAWGGGHKEVILSCQRAQLCVISTADRGKASISWAFGYYRMKRLVTEREREREREKRKGASKSRVEEREKRREMV